jgi:O-antigen/teichoic acid export membrane protein
VKFKDIVGKNQLFALLSKGLEGAKVILISIAIARIYAPEIFGVYTYVLAVVSIVSVIAEFRLQGVLIKEFTTEQTRIDVLTGSALVVNTIFAFVGYLVILSIAFFENLDIVFICLLLYSLSFFYKIPRCFRAYFIANERNYVVAKSETFASLFTIVVISFLIFYAIELKYILLIRALDFLVVSVVMAINFHLNHHSLFTLRFKFDVAKNLVLTSTPLVLSGAAMLVFQRVDIVFVRFYYDNYQAGLYGSATTIMTLFSLVPLVLSESLAPKMFRSKGKLNESVIRLKYGVILVSIGVLMSILMLFTSFFGIEILFGFEYSEAKVAALVLSMCPLLIALGAFAGQTIIAENLQKFAYYKSFAACAVTIIANILFVPVWGLVGAAISTVLGLLVANFIGHYFIRSYKFIFTLQLVIIKKIVGQFYQRIRNV